MAWTNYQIFLAIMMVITGSINTIATKFADVTKALGIDGRMRDFNHPFLQASGMFLGEMSCLFVFQLLMLYHKYRMRKEMTEGQGQVSKSGLIEGNQDFSPFIFLPPAMCDLVATSIMYVGLNLTYASSFQMLRGSVIVFTGLLSVAFLGRVLKRHEWIGIFFVIVGLVIVGVSDFVNTSPDDTNLGLNKILTGDLLIILGQIIAATQMVVEEKFVVKNNVPPLQAVGWEGLFGFVVLSLLIIPMCFIPAGQMIFKNPNNNLEDAMDAFTQLGNSTVVRVAFAGTIVSIAFFNFAGVSVTKEMSATTRMVLDSVRTLIIWIFSISYGWQKFSGIQLAGFFVLVAGMCLYNNVVIVPLLVKVGAIKPPVEEVLITKVDDEPAAYTNQAVNVENGRS